MDANLKKILKAVVLEMRHELEGYYDNAGKWHPGDLETRLAEIGVRKDRASVPVDELGRLIDEDVRAREIVDAFIDVREQAGVDRAEAVAEYIRESAYTWANRLVALRCMEARELLDDEVIVGREAYGGRSLVHHRLAQSSPELCTGEDDGRFAMLAQVFAERAQTLPMLFDPDSPSIALRPSPAALKNCLGWLSGTQKVRSQEPATDAVFAAPDALGWAYQYWNTEEKDRVFETVRTKKGAKIEGADIIPATQLYTEDYMVKFLVQNSLGATWMGMHPESKLFEGWEYYVRDADRAPAKKKPLQQITLLDPACGSGHFLIEAFDMFYTMYEEEGSLENPEAICKSILENNLFGIDIDERSIQIAEASLWMKAEEKSFGFCGANTNLVAATSSHLKGESWERYLAKLQKEPSTVRVLRKFAVEMEHIDELGSLARPAESLETIINEEHEIWEKQERERREADKSLFKEIRDDLLASQLPFQDISDKEFFERTMRHALFAIDGFTAEARESGEFNDQLMGAEAKTGFRLLDLLSRKYDVVVANPPYMGSKNMGPELLQLVTKHYEVGKRDLCTAFLARCDQLVITTGRIALVLQDSWMFLWSYEELRTLLLTEREIEGLSHIGPKGFAEIGGEVVSSVMLITRKCPACAEHRIAVVPLVEEEDSVRKANSLREKVVGFTDAQKGLPQRLFARIPGRPLAYALPEKLLKYLGSLPEAERFSSHGEAKTGMVTGNNRFLRYFWESSGRSSDVWYAKGQGSTSYCNLTNMLIDWRSAAQAKYKQGTNRSVVLSQQAIDYVNKECLSYSVVATRRFGARPFPGGVFDSGGSCLFFFDTSNYAAISLVNSAPYRLMLKCLNPTLNYQPVDFERLPWPRIKPATMKVLEALGLIAVTARELMESDDLTLPLYSLPSKENTTTNLGVNSTRFAADKIYVYARLASDAIVSSLLLIPLRTVYRAIGFSEKAVEVPLEELRASLDQCRERLSGIQSFCSLPFDEIDPEIVGSICNENGADFLNKSLPPSENSAVSPDIFAIVSKEDVAESPLEEAYFQHGCNIFDASFCPASMTTTDVVENVLITSVAVKVLHLLGFTWPAISSDCLSDVDDDGIIPLTNVAKESSLHDRLFDRFGADDWKTANFAEVVGKPLDDWLNTEFFKHHTKVFKKRPIAWQLQSSTFTSRKSPAFACLAYYHRMDVDSIPKVRSQYTGPLKVRFETEMRGISSTPAAARTDKQAKRTVELEEAITELQTFDEKLAAIAISGFGPNKLLPKLRQYAFDDAMLSMKAHWLRRLSDLLARSHAEDAAAGMRDGSPLDQWQSLAIETGLHPDLARWISEAISHLSYFCSQVGPKAPNEKKTPEDPTASDFAELIDAATGTIQTSSMKLACGVWWGKFDAAVLAPIRERIKILKAEQKELNAAIKEDRQPVLVAEQVREESSEYDSSEIESAVADMPLLGNHVFEPTIELTKAAMKARLKEVKAKIKKFTEEMDSKAGKAQAIRDAIQAWRLPDPIPASLDFSPSSPNLPPLFDQVSSLDERRAPPKTIADFIAQESLYAPDINDGVRVNIAPLQKAGVLAADVLAAKDVDKAIADRAEWRADERRWVREGKLPQPGWWKVSKEDEPQNALND